MRRLRLIAPRRALVSLPRRTALPAAGEAPLSSVGFAFDIDGCLIRGGRVLPEARAAVARTVELGVPHVYLTNGGGMTERAKAEQLEAWLGVAVDGERQVVLSHTPMREIEAFRGTDRRVLVVGTSAAVEVARGYGFRGAVAPSHLVRNDPSLYPFTYCTQPGHGLALPPMDEVARGCAPQDVEAVMVFHDGLDWGLELQVIVDVLSHGLERGGAQVPVYFSNGDLLWSNEQRLPRLGQGAFGRSLRRLWKDVSGRELEVTMFGKPEATAYDFSRRLLETQAGGRALTHLYGFGDNPESDVRGANDNGWHSVLVRTGVFRGPADNCEGDPAHLVCSDVGVGVERVLALHGAAAAV